MGNKKTRKVIVMAMLIAIIVSTLLVGLSAFN